MKNKTSEWVYLNKLDEIHETSYQTCVCKLCGFEPLYIDIADREVQQLSKYCPNCGCMMTNPNM